MIRWMMMVSLKKTMMESRSRMETRMPKNKKKMMRTPIKTKQINKMMLQVVMGRMIPPPNKQIKMTIKPLTIPTKKTPRQGIKMTNTKILISVI